MSPIFSLLWGEPAQAAELAARMDSSSWQAIDHQAGQHRLRPLLHVRAVAGSWRIPPVYAQEWHEAYQRSARRALLQKGALAKIGRSFRRGGVTVAVLKGGAFLWAGGIDPAVRPMRDLDLLVRPEDAETACALLRELGFVQNGAARPSGKHLPAFSDGTVVVELHLRVLDTQGEASATREAGFVDGAWARKVAGAVPGMLALSSTDTLLHLILHAVFDHQFNNGPLLLVDLLALTEHAEIDWPLLWQEAERLEAIRACQLALTLGERLCGFQVDWCGHAPADLDAGELDAVERLMLADRAYSAAIGWPGQLLRFPLQRWPKQLRAMFQRRRTTGQSSDAGIFAAAQGPGIGALLSFAVGAEGRARIADAIRLTFWLRR